MSDPICIPVRYTVDVDGVMFDLDAIKELLSLATTIEAGLNVRLEPRELVAGYAHYRSIAPQRCIVPMGTNFDSNSVPHSALIESPDQMSAPTHEVGSEADAPKEEAFQENVRGGGTTAENVVIAMDGRSATVGSAPLVLPMRMPSSAGQPSHTRGWADLTATGETYLECTLSSRKRCIFHADQIPSDVGLGDEIEVHGVRSESITMAKASSPQLQLDFVSDDGDAVNRT
jgi:hypothetical protein